MGRSLGHARLRAQKHDTKINWVVSFRPRHNPEYQFIIHVPKSFGPAHHALAWPMLMTNPNQGGIMGMRMGWDA